MRFSKLLLSFVFLVIFNVIDSSVLEERYQKNGEYEEENGLVIRDSWSLDREKRGAVGFFVMARLTAMQVASTGFTLAQALAEGCVTRKNICKHRDAIEKIEKELEILGAEYDTKFRKNQWKYLNLKTSMINNEHILRIIDDQLNLIDDIGTRIEIITTTLELNLETMTKMFAESNDTQETANVFEKLIEPFEYQLEQIEGLIKSVKDSQIRVLVSQKITEVFFRGFWSYTNKVVEKAKMNLDPDDNIFNRVSSSNNDLPDDKKLFWTKTKNYFNTKAKKLGFSITAIANDVLEKFKNIKENVMKWFKASVTMPVLVDEIEKSSKSKIVKIKNFFDSPIRKTKTAVKNYKFQKGQAFASAMSLVIDTITIIINEKQWENVESELLKARTEYEKFLNASKDALKQLDNETLTLDLYWSSTISSFQDLVRNFTNITNTARENKLFSDIYGLTGIPVDTSDPFFHTNFTQVTQKNIKPKQKIVIDFFKANDNSLSVLRDKFKIQQILISETKELVQLQEPISSIFDNLVRIYKNYDTQVLVEYSSRLVPRDIVCSTSMIFPNKTEYDCYALDIFRNTKCNISNATFANIEQQAADKCDAVILQQTIQEHVPKKAKPSLILDLAKGVYAASKEQRLKDYGNGLKEKDVVCEISVLYPDLNTYMLYDLTRLRPDCAQVSDVQFQQMKANIVKMENAKSILSVLMKFCLDTAQPCACPSAMTLSMQITVDQVLILIDEYKQEHKPNCEFIVGNTSCNWSCPLTTPIN